MQPLRPGWPAAPTKYNDIYISIWFDGSRLMARGLMVQFHPGSHAQKATTNVIDGTVENNNISSTFIS